MGDLEEDEDSRSMSSRLQMPACQFESLVPFRSANRDVSSRGIR